VSLLPEPAPGLDDPLGLLRACHERILHHCELLIRLSDRLTQTEPDQAIEQTAASVHRYFSLAARHHHEDEDQDLFPLLHADPELAPLLDTLSQEHRRQDEAWDLLAPRLRAPESIEDRAGFGRIARAFARDNLLHVETEERFILPRAETLLDPEQTRALSEAMARRRGLDPAISGKPTPPV
jgi:hemerythrin-like domain-containing protein